jgi:lactate permease
VLGANLLIGTPPAGALGALAALLLHLLVGALRGRRAGLPREVRRAAMPYLLLIGGVVAAMLVVRATGQFETAWRALASPAVWLVVATVATATVTTGIGATDIGATGTVAAAGARSRLLRAMLPDVAARWWRVGPATALFLVFGVVMAVSGMSQTLALALAGLGGAYLVAVPAIGALGGFMTGSNSGANAMFAAPQAQAVTAIGADLLPAMAVHNVAAALFMMASPARVELAVQLTSDRPRAAVVQRTVLVVDLAILAVLTAGLLVLLLPTL